jgi:plasmid maintenance system antidote protein VapI
LEYSMSSTDKEYTVTHARTVTCGSIPIRYTAVVTIPEKLKAEMDRLGMRPTRFAAFCGVPQPLMSKWLSGAQGLNLKNAAKVGKATGHPAEHFMATQPDPDVRIAIAAAVERLGDDAQRRRVLAYAERLADRRPSGAPAPRHAPIAGQSGKGKRSRGRSNGSAPAA